MNQDKKWLDPEADPLWQARLTFLEESAPSELEGLLQAGKLASHLDDVYQQALRVGLDLEKRGLRRDEAQEIVLKDVVQAPPEQPAGLVPRQLSPEANRQLEAFKKARRLPA